MNNILIVDDEESIRWVLKKGLEKKGYTIQTAASYSEAVVKIKKGHFFLAFFDIMMPGESGLELLGKAKEVDEDLFVIIMTAQDTMKNAISAMQKGAFDYIAKPFDFDEIYALVKKVLDLATLKGKVTALETELKNRFEAGEIVGKSRKMREIFKTIGKAASSDLPILITGESGTGKELIAKAIHHNSSRVGEPFISINCAAVPGELMESEMFGHEKGAFTGAHTARQGKFELANKGTLFLDEIGEMDINLQAKILRVIQEKEFVKVGGSTSISCDVRIISATNIDLETAIQKRSFRNDLYHRLNVININVPPLRERREDISSLIDYFLRKFQKETGGQKSVITQDTANILESYEWKGNVRELENAIKRAVVLSYGNTITVDHLPSQIRGTSEEKYGKADSDENRIKEKIRDLIPHITKLSKNKNKLYDIIIKETESVLIETVLKETEGNQVQAAKILGINRNTLARKIKELIIA